MKVFPPKVLQAMDAGGGVVTCLPVQMDQADWEAAIFFRVSGPESKLDRRALNRAASPLPVAIEGDLIEAEHAAVVILRAEVHTRSDDPLHGEILLLPGGARSHFETLQLLSKQPRLCWFFGDASARIIHSQQHALDQDYRDGFSGLLSDAVRHDAMIRCTGRYDAQAAFADVVSHYALRPLESER